MLFDVGVFQFVPVARTLEVVKDDLFVEALHHRAEIVSAEVCRRRVAPSGRSSPWRWCH